MIRILSFPYTFLIHPLSPSLRVEREDFRTELPFTKHLEAQNEVYESLLYVIRRLAQRVDKKAIGTSL